MEEYRLRDYVPFQINTRNLPSDGMRQRAANKLLTRAVSSYRDPLERVHPAKRFMSLCMANAAMLIGATAHKGPVPYLLDFSLESSDKRMADLLTRNGADVNASFPDQTTLLMHHAGSLRTVRFLLRKGADATAVSHNGQAAASYATGRNADEIKGLLRSAAAESQKAKTRA